MALEDRLVEYPNRYTMTDANGNTSTVFLDPDPGEVEQDGTLLNAKNLTTEIEEIAQNATGAYSDSYGNAHFNNLQRGRVVAPSKGNRGKNVSVKVTFPKAFSATPVVMVNPLTSRPDAVRASAKATSSTGFTLYLYRSTAVGDSNTSVDWIAML